jgi:tetratricopeptide (TPR) repeat protein
MPVLESLERLARQPDADRLRELLRRVAPTWLAQMPWLIGDDAEALRHSLQATRAERMLREFASLTEALTTDMTLVLVLEDLHWSDPSTVDLLALLGQRREAARLLVIGIYRPAEIVVEEHLLSQAVRTLQVRRQCVELPVHELTETDVVSYLHARFPGAQVPPELAHVMHKHTDGNPLFVVAVVEHMLSRGWILDTSPGWAFTVTPQQIELGVPDDALRIIATQCERLGPADQSLLRAASVAGTEFAAQAIAAPLGWALDDVEAGCESLAHAQRFLRDAGSSAWPDGSVVRRYAFTHELYRQAVYEGTSAGRRQRLHQRIGEALETAYGERAQEIARELAIHFERSGDYRRALHHLAAAAARARQRFAEREAGAYLEAAIALAARLPDEGERRRRELELRLALAPIQNDLAGPASETHLENCERAYALCREFGDPAQLFQILYALAHVHVARADETRALDIIQELDELARRLGTIEHRLLADSALARVAAHHGRYNDARRIAEGPLSAHLHGQVSPHPFVSGADPVIEANCSYGYALWFLGYIDRALATMRDSVVRAERPDVPPLTKAAALTYMAVLELLQRNPAEVRRVAEQAGDVTAEHGFRFWNAIAAALHGWALVHQGEVQEGIRELEAARDAHAATGACVFSTPILAFLAEAHLRAGEYAAGLAAANEGLRVAETTLDRSFWPELWRLNGELLLAASAANRGRTPRGRRAQAGEESRWEEAEACLRRALDLARETEAKSLELRAATSLARMLRARARTADARAFLEGICPWFGADATNPDLIEARALLQQLSLAAP